MQAQPDATSLQQQNVQVPDSKGAQTTDHSPELHPFEHIAAQRRTRRGNYEYEIIWCDGSSSWLPASKTDKATVWQYISTRRR